jgi:hypothetical protein
MNDAALDMSLTELQQQCADLCIVLSAVTGCPERLARLRSALLEELRELQAKVVRTMALLNARERLDRMEG